MYHKYLDYQIRKELSMPNRSFRLFANIRHSFNTFERIVAFGRFAGQHHTVGAIEDRVGDVGSLRSRWAWLRHHRFQHLSRADDGFSGLFESKFS